MSKMFVLTGSSGAYSDKCTSVLAVSTNRQVLEDAITLSEQARKVNDQWKHEKQRFYDQNYDSVVPQLPEPVYQTKDHLSHSPEDAKKRCEINIRNENIKQAYWRKLDNLQKEPEAQLQAAAEEYANKMHPDRNDLVKKAISLHEEYEIDEVPIL